jgi:phage-related protein
MQVRQPIPVVFFAQESGREPVRDWLKAIDRESRRAIGADIKTLQLRWPVGMPLARKLGPDLWELRSTLRLGIARIFFTAFRGQLVLLHAFEKQSQKTPAKELAIARQRLRQLRFDP